MTIGSGHYAVLAGLLFCIGLAGVTTRRNAPAQLAALGVMFLAPVIAVVGFSQTEGVLKAANTGVAIGLIVFLSLFAQLAVGGGVVALLARRRHSVDLDSVERLEA